jgi:hypothetical protein
MRSTSEMVGFFAFRTGDEFIQSSGIKVKKDKISMQLKLDFIPITINMKGGLKIIFPMACFIYKSCLKSLSRQPLFVSLRQDLVFYQFVK